MFGDAASDLFDAVSANGLYIGVAGDRMIVAARANPAQYIVYSQGQGGPEWQFQELFEAQFNPALGTNAGQGTIQPISTTMGPAIPPAQQQALSFSSFLTGSGSGAMSGPNGTTLIWLGVGLLALLVIAKK